MLLYMQVTQPIKHISKQTRKFESLRPLSTALVLGLLCFFTLNSHAQRDPRDNFYTPPASSVFMQNEKNTFNQSESAHNWAIKLYPVRRYFSTVYMGVERSIGDRFSIAVDLGWHLSKRGMMLNVAGFYSGLDDAFDLGNKSSMTYADLFYYSPPTTEPIATHGFSLRYFIDGKQDTYFQFLQFQFQNTETQLALITRRQLSTEHRFAPSSQQANVQLQTMMLRYGFQWVIGKKVRFIQELSFGLGIYQRRSPNFNFEIVSENNFSSYYSLHTLTGETSTIITPKAQLVYSVGIGY